MGQAAGPEVSTCVFAVNEMTAKPVREVFGRLLDALREKCANFYGPRLVSLVVYGSVGRGVMKPDSDIDFLLVVEPLPDGRIRRVDEFAAVERAMQADLAQAREAGVRAELSPVFKTPGEVRIGSPLFLDMVEDAGILFDRDGFFRKELDRLRGRLARLGARRIWKGNAWIWDLKPDYKWGDEFEI